MTFTLPNLSTILSIAATVAPWLSVAASAYVAAFPPVQSANPVVVGLQAAIRAFALAVGHGTPAGAATPPASPASPPAAGK